MSIYGHNRDHRDDGCVIHLGWFAVLLAVLVIVTTTGSRVSS